MDSMSNNHFTYFFIALVLGAGFIRLWLSLRHIKHVSANRDSVPEAFKQNISLEAHQKAADYSVAKSKLAIADNLIQTLLLLTFTLGGLLQTIDLFWRDFIPGNEMLRGALVILSTLFFAQLVELPFNYYKTFNIDTTFGFNRMSPKMFFTDLIKESILGLIIGIPLLLIALWLMQATGHYWWAYLWLVVSIFSLGLQAIYPTFIAPFFNQFSPLEDQSLKSRIESLLRKCGFKSQGLFVMNGSARSNHGNAYFTGLGKNKRVVFFDTLLERLNADEIESVLAHELGHFKHHHVIKRIGILFFITFVGLAILGWIYQQTWFFLGLGVSDMSNYMAIILFLLVSPVFVFPLQPLMASYSRKNEFEADSYAARHASAKSLVSALVKLYRDNASTLTPDPVYSAFYDSHPPAALRISKLERLKI
jgi:STE24 endopeptidase